jgi:hypothetical protein
MFGRSLQSRLDALEAQLQAERHRTQDLETRLQALQADNVELRSHLDTVKQDLITHLERRLDWAIAHTAETSFAAQHHIACREKGFLYCFIPKNACSLFKTVAARYAADFSEPVRAAIIRQDFVRIHHHTSALRATRADLSNPHLFRFVVLRNPFGRAVSAYHNKFVRNGARDFFCRQVIKQALNLDQPVQDIDPSVNITFYEFVRYLYQTRSFDLNEHWRPQVDFLLFANYDAYLPFENLASALPALEHRLKVSIPRINPMQNSVDYRTIPIQEPWHLPPSDLLEIQDKEGGLPTAVQMLNPTLVDMLRYRYQADFDLYAQHCGEATLEALNAPG